MAPPEHGQQNVFGFTAVTDLCAGQLAYTRQQPVSTILFPMRRADARNHRHGSHSAPCAGAAGASHQPCPSSSPTVSGVLDSAGVCFPGFSEQSATNGVT